MIKSAIRYLLLFAVANFLYIMVDSYANYTILYHTLRHKTSIFLQPRLLGRIGILAMASTLSEWTAQTVTILTCDGRLVTGTLLGYDQLQNLILGKSYERVYSTDGAVERVELGLSVIRGDNVAVVSDTDGHVEGGEEIRTEPIKPIVQNVT